MAASYYLDTPHGQDAFLAAYDDAKLEDRIQRAWLALAGGV